MYMIVDNVLRVLLFLKDNFLLILYDLHDIINPRHYPNRWGYLQTGLDLWADV